MTFKPRSAIAAVTILLAGCGGSEGSGSSSTTVPPVAVIPTPTPTPTPKPSPSYATYDDPLADWRVGPPFLFTQSTEIRGNGVDSNVKVSIQSADMVDVTFSGRPDITANFSDFTRGHFANFSAADVYSQHERFVIFQKSAPIGHWIMGRWQPEFLDNLLHYCALVYADYSYPSKSGIPDEYVNLSYQFFIGSRTLDSDLPTPISETVYTSVMAAGGAKGNIPSFTTGDLTLSMAGTLSGKLTWDNASYVGVVKGSMDQQTNRITGDITAENGSYVGKFEGYLYGPKGKEIALIVYMKSADGTVATAGTIYGLNRYKIISPPPL